MLRPCMQVYACEDASSASPAATKQAGSPLGNARALPTELAGAPLGRERERRAKQAGSPPGPSRARGSSAELAGSPQSPMRVPSARAGTPREFESRAYGAPLSSVRGCYWAESAGSPLSQVKGAKAGLAVSPLSHAEYGGTEQAGAPLGETDVKPTALAGEPRGVRCEAIAPAAAPRDIVRSESPCSPTLSVPSGQGEDGPPRERNRLYLNGAVHSPFSGTCSTTESMPSGVGEIAPAGQVVAPHPQRRQPRGA